MHLRVVLVALTEVANAPDSVMKVLTKRQRREMMQKPGATPQVKNDK